ncbi:MAG: leucine-rich repeat domain-containing protein [Candidatus Lokiarchaeota archaeon]|nr:leucine-rich repeat domain-containing protein [Candidatus Lokiarchaeota archaeon]
MKKLKKLTLNNNSIEELKGLEGLRELEVLSIGMNQIENYILERLGGLSRKGFAFKPQEFVKYCENKK